MKRRARRFRSQPTRNISSPSLAYFTRQHFIFASIPLMLLCNRCLRSMLLWKEEKASFSLHLSTRKWFSIQGECYHRLAEKFIFLMADTGRQASERVVDCLPSITLLSLSLRGAMFATTLCYVNWLWTKHVKICLRFWFTSLVEAFVSENYLSF